MGILRDAERKIQGMLYISGLFIFFFRLLNYLAPYSYMNKLLQMSLRVANTPLIVTLLFMFETQ